MTDADGYILAGWIAVLWGVFIVATVCVIWTLWDSKPGRKP